MKKLNSKKKPKEGFLISDDKNTTQKINLNIYTGMGKNASSFLREYFLKSEMLTIVQEEKYGLLKKIIDYSLRKPYYIITDEIKKEIKDELGVIAKKTKKNTVLIGATDFSSAYYNNYFHETNAILALKEFFYDYKPKVLFVFRRQDNLLESQYREIITLGYEHSIEYFLNYRGNKFERYNRGSFKKNISVEDLNFFEHVKYLHGVFGKKNVLAIPVELLKLDQEKSLQEICSFFGIKYFKYRPSNTNKSLDANSLLLAQKIGVILNAIGLKRFIKRYVRDQGDVKKIILKFSFFKKNTSRKFISNEMRKEILAMHNDDNYKLSKLINIDLKKMGYFK